MDNVAVVRRLEEAWANHDLDVLDEVLHPDFPQNMHTPGSEMTPPGIEGIKQAAQMSWAAFPDKKQYVGDLFGVGDKVVSRVRMTGTNEGGLPWFGIPANSKKVDVEWITIYRLEGGKVVETWAQMEIPKMMQQLGAMPGPEGM